MTSPNLAMPHMPATGVSGIDLYATDPEGQWRWLAVSRPTEQATNARLIHSLEPHAHDFTAYLPNMVGDEVAARAEPLVRQLRQAHADTPILLVEDRTYPHSLFVKSLSQRHEASRNALREAYQSLVAAGFKKLGYVAGETLLGSDRDDTTDGSHPSDLGFFRQADALEGPLRDLGA